MTKAVLIRLSNIVNQFPLEADLESLDWGGGGGGGSLGLIGALTAVVALIFSLKDCEIPRRPNRVEVEEPELLKASLIDGLEFIRMRVVSLNKCELLTSFDWLSLP